MYFSIELIDASYHESLLKHMAEGLAGILEGENEELKTRALAFTKDLVHMETFSTFDTSKLFTEIEKLSNAESVHQQTARTILAARE
jgi:hypothetical protein